ncbi:Bacitracin transport ATP-binding protein BcrA [Clostridium haemolyticum]|uniref:ATP-binding cassette domain-containing protein n=1 Tax=Clostridium haemolyticum TaxID=84025 RepID=UPI001C397955|nr:ATP-binding cassette domain-containing protein [Clostridium haemolyticum]CAG7838732.1 Bacitracin transport ATP-binding protein BcrA [Clostridium haemolyticum]
MYSIEVKNLSKIIKGSTVLNTINFSFEKGKIYGLYGYNGSGKTMFFRALSGLIKPTKGEIFIEGKKLHEDISHPNSLGILIEYPGFWDNYTGFENLKALSSIKNIINDSDIKKSIEKVGLNFDDKRTYKKYSLGMKQRLGIAQAIMEKPSILILDEPTNALDEKGVQIVHKILLEEKLRGTTVIIASHNKEDISSLSDIKLKMDNGTLEKVL